MTNIVSKNLIRWLSRDKNKMLSVEKIGGYWVIYYSIWIKGNSHNVGEWLSRDLYFRGRHYFKTKSQALKFAKEYMKKH